MSHIIHLSLLPLEQISLLYSVFLFQHSLLSFIEVYISQQYSRLTVDSKQSTSHSKQILPIATITLTVAAKYF